MQLHRKIDELRATGAQIVVIGNGTPNFMAGFREQTGWQGPLYTDPSLATFQAAELERGVLKTFDPRALGATVRAFRDGQRQGRTQGDAWQQGGVLVVRRGGAIAWRHASARPGDNATPDQILAALR